MIAPSTLSILTSEARLTAPVAEVVADAVMLSVDKMLVEVKPLAEIVLLFEIEVAFVVAEGEALERVPLTANFRLFKSS
jgi:hypothetical protein